MTQCDKLFPVKTSLLVSFVIALLLTVNHSFAQIDYARQYDSGKSLFRDGKYNLAMESFKPLIPYDQKNQYSEYASFYYAVSAYHQGYKAVAKDMFNQIRKTYPQWDKLPEVNFWLGKIHFDDRDYFQGLKVMGSIQDKKFEKDIESVKIASLASITDLETLKMMNEEYPKDAVIGKQLAAALSRSVAASPEDKQQLEQLIDQFKLKRADFIAEAPKTFYKDKYSVSLMLPFMVSTLEPTGRRRSQIFLDFYEGAKLAIDTLSKQKIDISLRAYDTERNVDKVKKLLETEEIRNTDLILGPIFPEESKVVQDFSANLRINIFHPFSNNTDIIGPNPYAFLFQPSGEIQGKKSAEYVAGHARGKKTMVFYGQDKKDSVMAANYVQQAKEKGMKILSSQKVNGKDVREIKRITDILATPTEFDEFKYPSQFTLKKDSLHSIFVASDDPLIYTKVVGAVEMRGDSVLVVGDENWLERNAIDLEKYQTLKIVLASPNYWDVKRPHYKSFEKKFLREHGRLANNVVRMGYELMLFLGNQLKTNGVYFQEGLSRAGILPGYLGEGFDYRTSHDNQVVPFITLKRGELTLIEKR